MKTISNNVCELMDVAKAEENHLALADAQEEYGTVDSLTNNAGVTVVFKEIAIIEFRRWDYHFLYPCKFVYNKFTRDVL